MADQASLTQGSAEWHLWRAQGIGASEAGAVMGISPWMTPYQLWKQKVGIDARDGKQNWAQARGTAMEPKARAIYEFYYGLEMEPVAMEHAEFPWIRASLDGFNREKNILLEIKCPGLATYEKAAAGDIEPHYAFQLEQQLLVSGADTAHFFVYYEKAGASKHAMVVYRPVRERREALLAALHAFWACVQTRTPPPLTTKDTMEATNEKRETQDLFSRLLAAERDRLAAKRRLEEAEAVVNGLKSEAARAMPHDRVRHEGAEIVRKGEKCTVKFLKEVGR